MAPPPDSAAEVRSPCWRRAIHRTTGSAGATSARARPADRSQDRQGRQPIREPSRNPSEADNTPLTDRKMADCHRSSLSPPLSAIVTDRPLRHTPCRFGAVGRCVDQTSGCAQNSPLWDAPAIVAISSKNVPNRASGTGPGRVAGRYSVSFVAVNAEQAEAWNGPSGRPFVEQRERWERMRGRLTARLLAGADPGRGERSRHRVRLW